MADDDSNIQIINEENVAITNNDDTEYDIDEEDFKNRLDSPFLVEENPTVNELQDIGANDEIVQDKIEDSIDPIQVESEDIEDAELSEIELLRRQVNTLKMLVDRNNDIQKYANCIDSVFSQDIKFEIAWNYVISKMQYESMTNNLVLNFDETKLNLLKSNLDRIRRIFNLIRLTRTLGSFSMEDHLVEALINKEFDFNQKKNNVKYEDMMTRLESMMNSYADKIKDEKIK